MDLKNRILNMQRWQINLVVLWMAQVVSLISFGFGLPFIPYYIQELGVTDPVAIKLYTGILSAAPAITMAMMSPIWGILSDRFGQKLMLQRAMIAAFFIIGAMGFAQQIWHLVLLRLFQGLFTGTVTAASAFVAVNTPNRRLSFALGFLSSSTFIGYSLGPLLGGHVAELFGYRTSFWVGAFVMIIAFLMVTFFVKPEKVAEAVSPDNISANADSVPATSLDKLSGLEASSQDAPAIEPSKSKSPGGIITYTIVLMLLLLFFQRVLRTVFAPFIPLYVQEITGTLVGAASTTGNINGFVGFATALSGIGISFLGDKYNKLLLIKLMLIASFFTTIAVNFANNLVSFTIVYTLIFLIIGGVEPLVTAMTAEQTDPGKRGMLFGIQGLVGSLGWMVSPAIGTYISIEFNYSAILWSLVALVILSYSTTAFITIAVNPPKLLLEKDPD